jgi:hypothetical protein
MGEIKLVNSWIALSIFTVLFLQKILLIENYALLAFARSSVALNCTEPDGLKITPKYV